MTRHKPSKIEEQIRALHEAQVDLAQDGLQIENYEQVMQNRQKLYHSLTGRYVPLRIPEELRLVEQEA
jgi:outer membrane protein TolC